MILKRNTRAGDTQYTVPADLEEKLLNDALVLARKAFDALGCRDMGRVDFRLDDESKFYILELNTLPGFTVTSLLPKAAAAAGIAFPQLCDRLVKMALQRASR